MEECIELYSLSGNLQAKKYYKDKYLIKTEFYYKDKIYLVLTDNSIVLETGDTQYQHRYNTFSGIVYRKTSTEYMLNGILHNINGPAKISSKIEYYYMGKKMSKKKYMQLLYANHYEEYLNMLKKESIDLFD